MRGLTRGDKASTEELRIILNDTIAAPGASDLRIGQVILNALDKDMLYNMEDRDLLATLRARCTLPKIKVNRLFKLNYSSQWGGVLENGDEFEAMLDDTILKARIGGEKVFHKRIQERDITMDEFVEILSEKFEFTLRE